MRGLLELGIHSGTIPKLFARLRTAERKAFASGDWRRSRALRQHIEDVEENIQRFVSREVISLGSCEPTLGIQAAQRWRSSIGVQLCHR